jgi:hypothetical protein
VAKKKKEPPSATQDTLADPQKNWADKPESKAHVAALKLYKTIQKAFENKEEQSDAISEYWDIYNANPDENQQYAGNSQGYIPAVRDAIHARAKRALKQLFPANNKYVDGLGTDGEPPNDQLALLTYYIRKLNLKSICRTDLIAGDVTGQWNLMIDWTKSTRYLTRLIKKNPKITEIDGEDVSDMEMEDPTDEYEDTEEEKIIEEGPEIVPFATEDLVVIPPTCTDLQKAKAVVIRLRLSPDKVRELEDEGVFILPKGSDIDQFCEPDKSKDKRNPAKKQTSDAGVKTEGTYKHAVIYMAYEHLDLGGEHKESAIVFYSSPSEIVGLIKNPLWSAKVPVLSAPVEQMEGSFFGKSKIEPVKFLQWQLTDFWNMGQDSAMYSLLPVFAVDPLATPQWSQLTIGLAAVWPVAPTGVKSITQPQLWKDAAAMCDTIKRQIWESMDVNEAMMGKMPQGRKNAGQLGAMQQEQQINIIDHASRYEDVMLNPLMEFLFELDQQFRTKELMVESRGEIGVKAALKTIPVQEWENRYFFRWCGTEFQAGVQRMQQQIAWMNVLKGIPPAQMNGKSLDVTPIIEAGTESMFGPELAPKILVDNRNMFTIEPDVENEMMHNGFEVKTHEADNDPEHIQSHMKAAATNGDPTGLYKTHMAGHMQQMQKKREMQMAAQQPQPGQPGAPGGAGPGVAGAPRPGAMPGPQRPGGQQPPGAIHTDQVQDGSAGARG